MSPPIKLTYFSGRGQAELPRMILAAANMEYDNVRVKREDWKDIKPSEWSAPEECHRSIRAPYGSPGGTTEDDCAYHNYFWWGPMGI